MDQRFHLIAFLVLVLFGCKKEEVVFEDNDIPSYSGISAVVLNNYVNRLFIDVIGREPLDIEMELEVQALRNANLGAEARRALVDKLMLSTDFVEGDSSYRHAYSVKLYENMKARFIEGASDALINQEYNLLRGNAIQDSLNGDMAAYAIKMTDANRLLDLLDSQWELRENEISIDEMAQRMMFNALYDQINMNTFNFVNASFDDTFFRFPSDAEFETAYQIVELNQPGLLFGQSAQNKLEYLQALTQSVEFHEGMVTWAFQSLLSRNPSSEEVFSLVDDFQQSSNFSDVQAIILISDEYAGFD